MTYRMTPPSRRGQPAVLREQEGIYRRIAKGFPNGALIVYDRDLRYLLADGQGLADVGLTPGDLEGKTLEEVFDPDLCKQLRPVYEEALEGRNASTEVSFANRRYELRASPLKDEAGAVLGGLAVTQDITARYRAEKELATHREHLEHLVQKRTRALETATREALREAEERRRIEASLRESREQLDQAERMGRMGYWEMDPLSGSIHWSQQTYQLLELDPSSRPPAFPELLEKVVPADRDRLVDAMQAAYHRKVETVVDLQMRLPGERLIHLSSSIRPVTDEEGRVLRLVGTIQDTTARKRSEEALLRAEKLASVGTLAAGLAHQFNNINTVVLTNLSFVLASRQLPDALRIRLEKAHGAIERSAAMTDNLLGFARSSAAGMRQTRLCEMLERILGILRRPFESEGIAIAVNCAELPPVLADANQLEHVLFNLATNARDAVIGSQNPTISFFGGEKGSEVYLSIRDNGCGIAKTDLDRIFNPFYTTKEIVNPEEAMFTRKSYGGSGLGLSLAEHIVRLHDGRIEVQSEPGHGTTFTIYLPTVRADEDPAA